DEAARAAAVVRRLRDFFRNHATELQFTDMEHLLCQAVDAQSARAAAEGVQLYCSAESNLPPLWVDRIQISVVLRNLIANALDAVGHQPAESGGHSVEVRAVRRNTEVVVSVID